VNALKVAAIGAESIVLAAVGTVASVARPNRSLRRPRARAVRFDHNL
jgi:hypothetical protein